MAFDTEKILNHISLVGAYVNESVIETFRERILTNPETVADDLPKTLDQLLSAGNGFFRGIMCGGPYPPATAPLISAVGIVYPLLEREQQMRALNSCLDFLDGVRYDSSQENMEYVHEPLLLRDVIMNRSIYWPGFNQYSDKIKACATWDDFEKAFMKEGRLAVQSAFLLSNAVCRTDVCNEHVRRCYTEAFPDLLDRTKDALAGFIHMGAAGDVKTKKIPYQQGVEDDLKTIYPLEWSEDLKERIRARKWNLVSSTTEHHKDHPSAMAYELE